MAPRLVPLEVPEGPDDPSMPQILAMKFTFLRCQPQWELTIPPIKQAKPIGKHLGFQFPFIEGEQKKYTDVFKSGGNILDQSASKALK